MSLPAPAQPYADLVVYRWSERSLLGGTGVGPVATSLDDEQLRRWDGRLASMMWAAEGSTEDGFLYTSHGGIAAILRKRPVRDRHGRGGSTLTHALIGPADWLDPGLALTLCRSDWSWLPPSGAEGTKEQLQRVPLARLRDHLEETADTLATEALRAPLDQLVPAVTAVLDSPGSPITLVDSPLPPEVVVWVLYRVLGPLTEGAWTFATRENSDSGPGLPRFVFVSGTDRGSLYAPSDRLTVRAASTPAVPHSPTELSASPPAAAGSSAELAAQLVEFCRRRGPDGLGRLLPAQPLRTAHEVAAWQKIHHMAPGVLADVRMLLEDAASGRLDSAARQYLAGPANVPRIEVGLRKMDDAALAELVRDWTARRHDLVPYIQVRRAMHQEVLRRLLAPGDDGDDTGLLGALRTSGPDPEVVRHAIDVALTSTQGRGIAVDVLRVLQVAHQVGLDSAELGNLRAALVDGMPSWQVIHQTHRIAATDPVLGRKMLAACIGRRLRGEDRRRLLDVLHRRRFLAEAVQHMSHGDPHTAVELYIDLIECVAGRSVGRGGVEEVLVLAGPCPSAPLLKALHVTAGNSRVRHFVEEVVADEYFRMHLVRADRDERRSGPPDAGRY
ncbi:hypothetical protein ACWEQ7_30400 [Streptomyces sp. NPDC004069]